MSEPSVFARLFITSAPVAGSPTDSVKLTDISTVVVRVRLSSYAIDAGVDAAALRDEIEGAIHGLGISISVENGGSVPSNSYCLPSHDCVELQIDEVDLSYPIGTTALAMAQGKLAMMRSFSADQHPIVWNRYEIGASANETFSANAAGTVEKLLAHFRTDFRAASPLHHA